MSNRNTEGIRAHAASRAEETRTRAEAAIETLKGRGERITFAAVARESGLSRSSLHSNDYVKVRIRSLQALEAVPFGLPCGPEAAQVLAKGKEKAKTGRA